MFTCGGTGDAVNGNFGGPWGILPKPSLGSCFWKTVSFYSFSKMKKKRHRSSSKLPKITQLRSGKACLPSVTLSLHSFLPGRWKRPSFGEQSLRMCLLHASWKEAFVRKAWKGFGGRLFVSVHVMQLACGL